VTAVLVNGNPESSAIWGPLVASLERPDVVRLSPPGFGAPLPDGFDGTPAAYRDWLILALERLGGQVDLVGHDVGGSTVVAVAMARPDLLRSWVSDSLGVFDPAYEWHDLARQWQTPGVGEASVAALLGGSPADRVDRMAALGIPPAVGRDIAELQGPEMGRAILALYRAAAQPVMADLGRDLEAAAARPGLAVIGTEDHFVGSVELRRRSAARAGARTEVLDGLGHYWMVQDPARSARILTAFWAGVTTSPGR
jgi:pimeloyl-ACP methyl ester carboxylesterase